MDSNQGPSACKADALLSFVFLSLSMNFNRQQYLKVASSLSIPDKTAEGYITGFYKKNLIHREKQDCYYKTDALTSTPRTGESQDGKEVKD